MPHNRLIYGFAIISMIILMVAGCSNFGLEKQATAPEPALNTGLAPGRESDSGHVMWGVWKFAFDPATGEVAVVPDRNLLGHFDVTGFLIPPACNDCVDVVVNSFDLGTRILDADVTLRNPAPIGGRDVRGILYTNDAGHELVNADGWTALYDIPGGGALNPFKAFAKAQSNRVFGGGEAYTENYLVHIPMPPQYYAITFAVDASWPGNCREPYSVEYFEQQTLYDTDTENAEIMVDVLDWQNDVSKVTLVAPQINGQGFTQFTHVSGSLWHLYIKNTEHAPSGEYEVRVIATSPNPGDVAMHQYFTLKVNEWGVPANPVVITPPWLNFTPYDVVCSGDYAYIASGINGFNVFDISDPTNPLWLNQVDSTYTALGISVSGDFAFIGSGYPGLDIFDVSDPSNPAYVKTIATGGNAEDVVTAGGYAYLAATYAGLAIVDIDPVETAYVVTTVETDSNVNYVAISGDYAYITDSDYLHIVGINPPESAAIVKSVEIPSHTADGVAVSGGYAYVADYPNQIAVINIDPPGSASIVNSVALGSVRDVQIVGNLLYAVGGHSFTVLDITVPASPTIVGSITTLPGWVYNFDLSGDYALTASYTAGLVVVDKSTSASPSYVTTAITPGGTMDCAIRDNYAYIADYDGGIHTIDISDPFMAQDVHMEAYPGNMWDIKVLGDYIYVACGYSELRVYELTDPVNPSLAKAVGTSDQALGIDVDGEYAYVALASAGLGIVSINPLGSASVVKTVAIPGYVNGVTAAGGYAYIATNVEGLQIVDVDPVGSASVVQTVPMPDVIHEPAIDGDYAFVPANEAGLVIVDISAPASAFIVNTVDTPYYVNDVAVADGYAYVADLWGVPVVDVDPVESANILYTVDSLEYAASITVDGQFAYVGRAFSPYGGLRIVKLW